VEKTHFGDNIYIDKESTVLTLTQMKGKREFPPDIPASGDVLSHLSELEMANKRY